MAVYLIIDIQPKDRELYAQYVQKVPAIIEKHGGRYLARGGKVTPLMGDWNPQRITLIQFDDIEQIQKCFQSPEYLETTPSTCHISRLTISISYTNQEEEQSMLNTVALIGNLGADPEIRYSTQGNPVANARIAVNDFYKDAAGETQKRIYWFTLVFFGRNAEILAQYCSKGSKIGVSGKLVQRDWEAQDGSKRTAVEIRADSLELLGTKNGDAQQREGKPPAQDLPPSGDDSIPF